MKQLIFLISLVPLLVFAQNDEPQILEFSNESEFAMLQTSGNTDVETYNLKTLSKWAKAKRIYTLSGHYTLGYAEEINEDTEEEAKVETARNWDIQFKYEQKLTKKNSFYTAVQREGDDFSGIEYRNNYDLGVKYYFIKADKTKSFTELGYRYTTEKRFEKDNDGEDLFQFNKGRVYYEFDQKKSKELSYKIWVEYLPNFTDSKDYIISYEPSISYLLSTDFSLKTAYKVIYDNVPNEDGNEKQDTTLSTSIIARF